MVVGDSQLLIHGLLGQACIRDAGLTKNVAVAHIALQKLTAFFMCNRLWDSNWLDRFRAVTIRLLTLQQTKH